MIVHLPTYITIVIDIVAWFVIHMGVSFFISRMPRASFSYSSWLYRERVWEMNGILYSRYFLINNWKGKLPDGAALFQGAFEKKHMEQYNESYLEDFVSETCRAELTHWITFLFCFLFFIWNLWWVGIIMVIYALAVNVPCILAQRYNRIRLLRVLKRLRDQSSYLRKPEPV